MKRKAFTLIELAIALTIIGLMIGGSFQAVKAMREKSKVAEAKEQVRASKDAILGYVGKWPNLPSGTEFQDDLSPVKNNQHAIFYVSDANLSIVNNDICAYNTTALKVVDNGAIPPRTIDNVAFVVAHEGANYNMQTALNANVVNIYAPSAKVDDNATPVNIVDFYDDIVEWVTLDELQRNVDCSQNKLVILNDYALPRDVNNSSSYIGANIYADGGFSLADGGDSDTQDDYEWCLEDPNNSLYWLNLNTCNGVINIVPDCGVATFNQCTSPLIGSSSNPISGTYRLNIYVKDKMKTVRKSFSITIDADTSSGTGLTGLLGGSSCTLDSQCASGDCLPSGKCKN
ncbi:MAG: prepilin-type N-terminal cleavage/methylation domain-containing protein [Sulfurimonas sp.]|jgi:prepilin-type N-terminal cleavage/methylation domain-containing protein